MFSIGLFEIILILLAIVIFVKPEDMPKFFHSVGTLFRKLKNFFIEIKNQISSVTDEFNDTKYELHKTLEDRVDNIKMPEPDLLSYDEMIEKGDRITPKLNVNKKTKTKKSAGKTAKKPIPKKVKPKAKAKK